jgi:hypothetical protein
MSGSGTQQQHQLQQQKEGTCVHIIQVQRHVLLCLKACWCITRLLWPSDAPAPSKHSMCYCVILYLLLILRSPSTIFGRSAGCRGSVAIFITLHHMFWGGAGVM